MFDTAEIVVRAGAGGDGAISFRREKYVPFGGPDGGDGGNGGDVVLVAERGLSNLLAFRRNAVYRARRGENGRGGRRHGARGEELLLQVPVGTMVFEKGAAGVPELLADLEQPGQRVVAARGGRGGLGNVHFATSINQAPRIAQKGSAGEEKHLLLELRLIADVGIIGYPNVGKSTLLAAASAARPKIADYAFTTREPVVGVVQVGQESFVLTEIPGLIEGAHQGRGLGHDFLRHATRTRVFIHLVDGQSISPADDVARVNAELGLFDTALARKPQLIAVNKVDVPQVRERLEEVRAAFASIGAEPLFISAATGEGVAGLMERTRDMLRTSRELPPEVPEKVFRPRPRRRAVAVRREGDVFVVSAPAVERLAALADLTDPAVRQQLESQLARLGADRALRRAGARPGDRVRCGQMEWQL